MNPISFISWLLPTGGLIILILLILLLLSYAVATRSSAVQKMIKPVQIFIAQYKIEILFFFSFTSLLGSLFYSEILNLVPCALCWYGRICMYPIAIITGTALLTQRKDITIFTYPFILGGIALSSYHIGLQQGWIPAFLCSAESGVACSTPPFIMYGFITIPSMAVIVYITMLVTALHTRKS